MARLAVCNEDGTRFLFPERCKASAFAAAELIAGRLSCEATVVRDEDPETMGRAWSVWLTLPAPSLAASAMATAVDLCRLATRHEA